LANVFEEVVMSKHSLDEAMIAVNFYQTHEQHFGNKDDFDFLKALFSFTCDDSPLIMVCGTNEGQSISQILASCPKTRIHGFEIQKEMHATASRVFMDKPNVHIHYKGLSSGYGTLDVTGRGETAGLYKPEGRWSGEMQQGPVSVLTPAGFLREQGFHDIFYFLIDVEGHEQEVIKGMELETNADRFPLFQYELGGTWADSRRSGPWTQFTTALYLEMNGYDVYLIGSKDGQPALLPTPPEFFRYSRVHHEGSENGGQKYFVQGNALAVHKIHANPSILAIVKAAVRYAETF
jgi:FkbM family methyltransferase